MTAEYCSTIEKQENINREWKGPGGLAGGRTWVVQGQAGLGSGRFLVARRTLVAGSLILEERPCVVLPKTSVTLTCVNCCSRLDLPYLPCTGCGFPLCAACQPTQDEPSPPPPDPPPPPPDPPPPPPDPCHCPPPPPLPSSSSPSSQPAHSLSEEPSTPTAETSPSKDWHQAECSLLKANGWKPIPGNATTAKKYLQMLSVLRLLLHRGWRQLESHVDDRRKSGAGAKVEHSVLPIVGSLRGREGNILFEEQEIQHAAGVLDVNAFEWKVLNEGGQVSKLGRLIFTRASLFNSSCVPSCVRSINKDGVLEVRAARTILAGEELTICYADPLLPAKIRQEIFRHKHFTCKCPRCEEQKMETSSSCDSFEGNKIRIGVGLDEEKQGSFSIRQL